MSWVGVTELFIMALRSLGHSFTLFFAGLATCLAQQPSGTPTLESSVSDDNRATTADTVRPAGTLVRPKDGVQHPDLDKAWTEYDASVAKVTESIKASIAEQFDAATTKGDLDAAEKWQMIGENFAESGKLPTATETKATVNAAVAEYKKARKDLSEAYEAVVKSLTMQKKIADAKSVRNESLSIAVSPTGGETVQAATTRSDNEPKAKTTKVPSMKGEWRLSSGDSWDITQRGNTITWAFQSNIGYKHLCTCEWDGERFTGVMRRQSPGSGCMTRLRVVITMLSETHFQSNVTALDANCDLPVGWKDSGEGFKR
jgi:hypothetical protein